MQTLTIDEITTALVGRMAHVVGKDAVILSLWQDNNPDAASIMVSHAVSPNGMRTLEKGGSTALAVLSGIYSITLSAPTNSATKTALATKLTDRLIRAFYQQQIPLRDLYVYTEEAYPSKPVRTEDKRISYPVTVRWFAWAGNYQQQP